MTLRRYRDMKPSGALWLGDVPSNWQVRRLKHLCAVLPSNVDKKTYEGQLPVKLCNYTDVYYNEEITADLEFMSATATPEQVVRFSLRSGDTIVTKDSETSNDIAVASYVPKALPGVVCGYHLAIVRPKGPIHGRYVKRLFDSKYLRSRFDVAANGLTRVGLSQYAFDNVEVPLPPRDEQEQIVAFLERETARVDALIDEQERLIALLKEKRKALIAHAVTKGLNADAQMKKSGIDWAGEVPAHWHVHLLKRAFSEVEYGISESLSPDGAVAVLRMGNIRNGRIVLDDLKYVAGVDESLLLRHGDLLFNRTNSLDLVGKVGRYVAEGMSSVSFASYLVRLRTTSRCDSKYLSYLLNTEGFLGVARCSAFVAIGQCNLNPTRYGELRVALPPRKEQEAIAEYLDGALGALDRLGDEAEQAVELLGERRNSLISAAVTGQIDVRELAPEPA